LAGLKTSDLPTNATFRKTSILKVGINICSSYWYAYAGGDPGFVGPKACTVLGIPFRKMNIKYEYKIRYESEYLFRMRKEVTTNYKLKKRHITNIKISRKNPLLFLFINCLTRPTILYFSIGFDCIVFDCLFM